MFHPECSFYPASDWKHDENYLKASYIDTDEIYNNGQLLKPNAIVLGVKEKGPVRSASHYA